MATKKKKVGLLEEEIKAEKIAKDKQEVLGDEQIQNVDANFEKKIETSKIKEPKIESDKIEIPKVAKVEIEPTIEYDDVQGREKLEQPIFDLSVTSKKEAEDLLSNYSYSQSDVVNDAQKALEDYYQKKPDEYVSSYKEQIDSLLDDILNRDEFTYDFNADPLYQQYKNQYEHEGMLAMQDTVAQLQSATGGYGSSYAAAAGSGAYQNYLNKANSKIPELYELALGLYTTQGEQMQDKVSTFAGQEESARNLYDKVLDDYYKEIDVLTNAAESVYDKDYKSYQDRYSYLEDMLDYYAGQEQQAIENEKSQDAFDLAVKKYEESVRQWELEYAMKQQELAAKLKNAENSSSGSSNKNSSSANGKTYANTVKVPKNGLTPDAKDIQQKLIREINLVNQTAGTKMSNREQADVVKNYVNAYYKSDIITKEEANYIGANYGVKI